MNRFFDGEFMTFGLDVIRHMEADQEDRMDPMIYIFPRMTKCTFYKYGVSGEVSITPYSIQLCPIVIIIFVEPMKTFSLPALYFVGGTT